ALFGSGIIWPRLDARQIEQVTPSIGFLPEALPFDGSDVYRLTIEPGQTVTFVIELATEQVPRLSVWRGLDYEKRSRNRQLLYGILLGITGLLAVFLSAVFAANHKAIFPSAALFTWCVFAYLCVDFGFWHKLFTVRIEENAQYRAATEAAIAATLLLFTHTFLRLGAWHGFARLLLRLWILGQVVLIGIAFLDPKLAATFARISIGIIFALGSLFILYLALRGQDRALSLVPTWLLFGIWLAGVALVLTGRIPNEAMVTALVSGLVLIVLLIGFTVTQYAFRSAEPLHALSANDQALRLLALDNAGVAVWEWAARRDEIKAGPAMETALGLGAGDLNATSKVFLERMHPVDRDRLTMALETIKETGEGEVRLEFRMRHTDDDYRWFELDAAPDPAADRRRMRCVGLVREITDRRLAADRLTYDAVHDNVTSLPNRALFLDRLEAVVLRARNEPLVKPTVLVIDVDRVQGSQTASGHYEADGLLIAIARRLQHLVGPGETLARIGSDQFGILLIQDRSERELQMLAEGVRLAVRSIVKVGQRDITPMAAIGYASFDRTTQRGAADVLDDAEIAMHRARRAGRDQVLAFDPGMRSDRNERVQLEQDLRAAIASKQLTLEYQPINALRGRQLHGFEALVRWHHPRLGLLNPAEFVPLAEESDLIILLGGAVLQMAVADAQRWHKTYDRPDAPLTLSVNISRRQLMSAGLVSQIRQILSASDLPKGSLRLEVTETLVMENPEKASAVLEELAAAGVGLSLDDFGTGYSSLTYLNLFPFDTIKVDRALVHGANQTGTVSAILRSVVALAHELGKKVIAEGVETEEDASVLRALGCEFAQGAYFDAALGQREVLSLLKDLRKEERRLKRSGLLRLKSHAPKHETVDAVVADIATAQSAPIPRRSSTLRGRLGATTNGGAFDPNKPANGTQPQPDFQPQTQFQSQAPVVPPSAIPLQQRMSQVLGGQLAREQLGGALIGTDDAFHAAQASLAALTEQMVRAVPEPSTLSGRSAPPPMPRAEFNAPTPLTAMPPIASPSFANEAQPTTPLPMPPVFNNGEQANFTLPPERPTTAPDFSQLPPEIAQSLARLAGRGMSQPVTKPMAVPSSEEDTAVTTDQRTAAKA
ncbi:MAG: EAL domain-containing protein, partial [Hyphomicrobiaceae bacterium]|nr:EAL domain-containing protein [Hyphomicrobiaceae bacterium]